MPIANIPPDCSIALYVSSFIKPSWLKLLYPLSKATPIAILQRANIVKIKRINSRII